MFTIFGASGNTGSVVASTLLARGEKVRVVARDPARVASLAGAEVVRGDVLDRASVEAALDGARGAYVLFPPDNANPDLLAQYRRIAEIYVAAIDAKRTPHVVVLSSVAAHEPAGTGPIVGTHVAEQVFLRAKAKRTFIRAAYFMENLLGYAHPMKQDGVLPVFGGGENVRFPMIATNDIGRVAAESLLAPPPSQDDIIELAGPTEYSFAEAAELATNILGRAVKPAALPLDAMIPTLTGLGFSENVAGLYREMTEALGKGLVTWDGKGRRLRGTVTLESVLRAGLTR